MRKIGVVGAGQGGLFLAILLQQKGYDVTLVSDQPPENVSTGRILSNQCMWGSALALERLHGLDFWSDPKIPVIPGFEISVLSSNGARESRAWCPLTTPGKSIDQRLKVPAWIERFKAIGGKFVVRKMAITDLDEFVLSNELTVVSTGKGRGEMKDLFKVDTAASTITNPGRVGASIHVTGMRSRPKVGAGEVEDFAYIRGIGEFWIFPSLSVRGPCHIICLQGVPGGPLDCWSGVEGPEAHLWKVRELTLKWMPWVGDQLDEIKLVDDKGFLSGAVPNIVRRPIAVLPSGGLALALGDAFVLNDPISQQGSNNATRAAAMYFNKIVEHGSGAFGREWMEGVANAHWEMVKLAVRLTKQLLSPPAHYADVLQAAATSPRLARTLADANDDINGFFPWIEDEAEARRMIFSFQQAA